MLSLYPILAMFILMVVASGVYFVAKKVDVPYTVLLVISGVLLAWLAKLPFFSFVTSYSLTPALLFYIFLPLLIFESAYNMNIHRVIEQWRAIWALAIGSLLISICLIGIGLYVVLPLVGLQLSLVICLLFGAIISSTDPVAVLALFKEFGAPRRLALLFEGESLFNDGTAVAAFVVLLSIITSGWYGWSTASEAVWLFSVMIIGGLAFGVAIGGLFSKTLEYTKSSEAVSITLMLAMAHLTFILAELISSHLQIGGVSFPISPIIATTVASMVMGNYGRTKISPKAEEFVEKFWTQMAFVANSLVFLLIGLLLATFKIPFGILLVPILLTVALVATARALSIYPVLWLVNRWGKEDVIPRSWQHLMAWGSLRGALAVILAMLIPAELTVAVLAQDYSLRDLLVALTIGCIFASILVKATTIRWLMRRLRIDALHEVEQMEYRESRAIIHQYTLNRLNDLHLKGYVDEQTYINLTQQHQARIQAVTDSHDAERFSPNLAERVFRIHAIGIEKYFLKELFAYGEVTEKVYKRILAKLMVQLRLIESGKLEFDAALSGGMYFDPFERLAGVVRKVIGRRRLRDTVEELYMYYRAQSIISRKVVKELSQLAHTKLTKVFHAEALERTLKVYEIFQVNSTKKMNAVAGEHPAIVHALNRELACRGLFKAEEAVLKGLFAKEMITPKLYIALEQELRQESCARAE